MEFLGGLSDDTATALRWSWEFWQRPKQITPAWPWRVWLIMAGRGFGKNRTAAEWVREKVDQGYRRIALVARTAGDCRKTVIEGESGILAITPPWDRPEYKPSNRELRWPNGAIATTYSSKNPEQLRGPQHDAVLCDELATWLYPRDTWSNLMFGLRLGENPQCCVATTPRPTRLLREIISAKTTHVTTGTTYENQDNLAPAFFSEIITKYEGTTLGRQELNAELLEEIPGALWTLKLIEKNRVRSNPELIRIVIAVDPAVTSNDGSDETGIVVCGLGEDMHCYVLEDRTGRYTPNGWATVVCRLYNKYKADRVVAEVNQGGDLVEECVRNVDPDVAYIGIHASKGKRARAEPVAGLDEQGRVHHVGLLEELEDEMTTWISTEPGASPNRIDARVYGVTELMIGGTVNVAPSTDEMEM